MEVFCLADNNILSIELLQIVFGLPQPRGKIKQEITITFPTII